MDTVIIAITEVCPLRCPGCYAYKKNAVMSFEDYKKILSKLPEVDSITLTGGEPFYHKDLAKIVHYTAKNKRKPRIVTSGFNIKYPLKDIAKDLEVVTVTLKYPNEMDSLWKGNDMAHKNALEFIKMVKKNKIPLNINWIADSENYKYMLKMQKFAEENGAMLQLIRFIPFTADTLVYQISYSTWVQLAKKATEFKNIHIGFPSPYSYEQCPAGIARMNILVNGDVTPCIYATENVDKVGNIIKESWEQIQKKLEGWRVSYITAKGCIPFNRLMARWEAMGWKFK